MTFGGFGQAPVANAAIFVLAPPTVIMSHGRGAKPPPSSLRLRTLSGGGRVVLEKVFPQEPCVVPLPSMETSSTVPAAPAARPRQLQQLGPGSSSSTAPAAPAARPQSLLSVRGSSCQKGHISGSEMDALGNVTVRGNQWQRLLNWHRRRRTNEEENEENRTEKRSSAWEWLSKINWREWVVDPADQFYYVWLQVFIFPIVYNWVIIILRTCFTAIALNYLPVWLTLDYLSDLMYVTDSLITLRTGFLEQGILITDPSRLKKRYLLSKHFLRDVASVLPTDLLYFAFGIETPIVRINRLLRTPRLNEALDRMETRTSYPNTFRISKLMIYIFVLIHWNACLYFALSNYIGFGSDRWVYPNITIPVFASTRRQYFYCFWFSAQIFTTVGDTPLPSREEEYLFMIADLLIAVLVFASIVGNVGNVITSLRDRDNVFFPNHELVKAYLRSHHISKELRQRIDNWYQHLHINKKIMRENEILQQLPLHLRTEIAVSVHLPTLSKVTIFQNCETSLLEELVLKLNPQVFSPGEYVCRKGDVGHEMYIIKEGKLSVVADDGVTEFAVLSEGNFFGEISILNIKGNKSGNRRTANIRSNGYSDLFSLSKEDLTDVLSEFPAAKRHLEEKGRQILTKMGMLEESGEGEAGEKEQLDTRICRLQDSLEALQTKLARLMVEQESSNRKMRARVEQLEWEVAAMEAPDDSFTDGDLGLGRGQGVGGEPQLQREEAEGEEETGGNMTVQRGGHGRDGGDKEVTKEGDGESTKSTKENGEGLREGRRGEEEVTKEGDGESTKSTKENGEGLGEGWRGDEEVTKEGDGESTKSTKENGEGLGEERRGEEEGEKKDREDARPGQGDGAEIVKEDGPGDAEEKNGGIQERQWDEEEQRGETRERQGDAEEKSGGIQERDGNKEEQESQGDAEEQRGETRERQKNGETQEKQGDTG